MLGREPRKAAVFVDPTRQNELALQAMAKVGLEAVSLHASAGPSAWSSSAC